MITILELIKSSLSEVASTEHSANHPFGIFARAFLSSADKNSILKLKGDASQRSYYRLNLSYEYSEKGIFNSVIAMLLPDEQHGQIDLPFVNIGEFLFARELPAPEIYIYDLDRGLVYLQDLGNITLQEIIQKEKNIEEKLSWYKQALDILIQLQALPGKAGDFCCQAFNVIFDAEKYTTELLFFFDHYIYGLLEKAELRKNDFAQEIKLLCEELASYKKVFCHRDYHSRNLMVGQDKLYMLDFQDARLALPHYDLASLLWDSYVEIEEELRKNLISYYWKKVQADSKNIFEEQTSFQEFDRILKKAAIQRNIKAIGTFAYQAVQRNNYSYLKYIPRTYSYALQNLSEFPEYAGLKKILESASPKL